MTERKKDPYHQNETRERRIRNRKIGDKLRQMYDEVANEPVPDDFLKLLEEADEASDEDGSQR